MNKNKEFGKYLARAFYNSDLKEIPFVLNLEQANAFTKEYHKLEYRINTRAGENDIV